jgi:OOP family OmpA-OmpF porin
MESFNERLPTGVEVSGSPSGVEAKLIGLLKDIERPAHQSPWFSFDRLNFKSGKAELEPEPSREQLHNIAAILKAFPRVEVKIGGYTDSSGSEVYNKRLSQKRAEKVVSELAARGISRRRLKAEGYGTAHPVCRNDASPECQAQNRRIDLKVTAK